MTLILAYRGDDYILLTADKFRYRIKDHFLKLIVRNQINLNSSNFSKYIEDIQRGIKLFQLSKFKALIFSSTGGFEFQPDKLSGEEKLIEELETLSKLGQEGIFTAYFAEYLKKQNSFVLRQIMYDNGIISNITASPDNMFATYFADEMSDTFSKFFEKGFWSAQTVKEKIEIIKDYYAKIYDLFHGLAADAPSIAKIDREGFKWIQNGATPSYQTAYSDLGTKTGLFTSDKYIGAAFTEKTTATCGDWFGIGSTIEYTGQATIRYLITKTSLEGKVVIGGSAAVRGQARVAISEDGGSTWDYYQSPDWTETSYTRKSWSFSHVGGKGKTLLVNFEFRICVDVGDGNPNEFWVQNERVEERSVESYRTDLE